MVIYTKNLYTPIEIHATDIALQLFDQRRQIPGILVQIKSILKLF